MDALIQRIDAVRRTGRVVVFLCYEDRIDAIDSAVLRRAGVVEHFARPTEQERLELFRMDLDGLGFPEKTLADFAKRTGPASKDEPGFTFSDLRTRLLPEVLARAYPNRAVEPGDVLSAIEDIEPSPEMPNARHRRKRV